MVEKPIKPTQPVNTHMIMDKLTTKIVSTAAGFSITYILWKNIVTENLRTVECAFALFAVTAGIWMGWPFHMPYRSENPIYMALSSHLPYWTWTVLFFSFGFPSLIGCDKGHRFFWNLCVPRKLRIFAAFMSLWTWTFISLVFITDKSPGLSTVWAPIVAIYQLRILLWLWVNNGISQECSHKL